MDDSGNAYPAPPRPEEPSPSENGLSAWQQDGGANVSPAMQQPQQPAPQPAVLLQPDAAFAPPTYPGMPGVPLSWAEPAPNTTPYAGVPSAPAYPPAPQQGAPSTPAYPVYPGVPSVPLGSLSQGAYPTYPSYPASYPGYQGYPSTPLSPYGAPLTMPLQTSGSPLQRALVEPFPTWLSAALGVSAVALLLIAFFASVLAGEVDWADGARTAGLIAFALAFLGLVVAIVRGALGRRATSMLVLSAVLVVGLTAVGATGVFASPQIHGFQASSLEGSHDWQAAIHEYQLSGQQAPNAPNIARVLDEQGEQQTAQGHYAAAITIFNTVSTQYGQSGVAVGRATTGTFDAYSAWVKAKVADADYPSAIGFFDSYRISASCSASCASATARIEAQAEYQYGEALIGQDNFNEAITQFEAVTTNFATSSYAAQAHEGAAQAYLGLAQQETTTGCENFFPQQPSAAYTTLLSTYQTLVSKYADTTEGGQAKTALATPQDAVGEFEHAVSNATLFLSKHLDLASGNASNDYSAKITSSGMLFTFHKVALGGYYLTYIDNTGTAYYIGPANQASLFTVKPLCTNDIVEILD